MLIQRQFRWIGHVIRRPSNRLPRRILYGELLSGRRHPAVQKKRFSDNMKLILKCCHIPPPRTAWGSRLRPADLAWHLRFRPGDLPRRIR